MFQLTVLDHDIYILCHVYFLYCVQFLRNCVSCEVICMHQNETCLTECMGYLQLNFNKIS